MEEEPKEQLEALVEDPEAEKVEAVTDKAAEGVEEPVVEPSVEALEAGEIFRQRPQQDTRLSLGRGGY